MVRDLDSRIAGLQAQSAQLQARPGIVPPPAHTTLSTPAITALPLPDPAETLDPLDIQVSAGDHDAFLRRLRQNADRQYLRRERTLIADNARALQEDLRIFDEQAALRRREVHQKHQLPLLNYTMNDMLRKQQGEQNYAFPLQVDPSPVYETELAQLEQQVQDERRQVKARRAADLVTAKAQLHKTLNTEIAERMMRWDVETATLLAEKSTTIPAPEAITFPTIPAGTIIQPVPADLPRAYQHEVVTEQQNYQSDLQAVKQTVARLRRQQRDLLAAITEDTRVAARAVAKHHGYEIVDEKSGSTVITAEVRSWLQDYWPAATGRN